MNECFKMRMVLMDFEVEDVKVSEMIHSRSVCNDSFMSPLIVSYVT